MSKKYLDKEKISIVITSYNQKGFLVEAIESALNQTLKPFEIIVVDDCSTDGSVELIADYERQYPGQIKSVFQKENLGVARNRSSGFKKATGDFITWANGDDRLLPRKLELEFQTYKNNPRARWVYSQVYYVDVYGRRTGIVRYTGQHRNKGYTFKDVATKIGKEPAYQLIERAILDDVGLFDGNLEIYEDWDFAIRLARHFESAYCPKPLYEYRQYEGGLSSSDHGTHLRSLKNIYKNIYPLLNNSPASEARLIKRILGAKICGLKALKMLDNGKRLEAARYLLQALAKDPKQTFYYEIGMMLLFPGRLSDKLRRIKRRYFKKLP